MGMTREEAIEILSDKVKPCLSGTDWNDAIDMAIKALEQESTIRNCFVCKYSKNNHNAGTEECHLCMWENQYTPTTKNDLGVDCISRDEVCRYVAEFVNHEFSTKGEEELIDNIITGIERMPSVTPQEPKIISMAGDADKLKELVNKAVFTITPQEPKTGHWIKISPANIYECSECGQNVMTQDICAYKFCHGCGAKMVEPQESEGEE